MEKLLKNKIVKMICVYINPLILGGVFSALGNWDSKGDKYFYYKLAILVVLGLFYAYTSYQYTKFEKDLNEQIQKLDNELEGKNKQIQKLESEKECFSKETRALSTLFIDSSTSINEVAKNVLDGHRILDVWNFKKVCTGICNSIYDLLCEICKPYDDFSVNIVLDDITATGTKKNVTMIAHKGKYAKYPGKFEEKMYYNKNSTFYAIKLFKSKSTDIKILTTRDEVNEKFVYLGEEHPEYSQYVGIPIVCAGNKMICLLQICSFKDNKIANTKTEIMDVIMTYILPFTQFALMNYKVEKGFVSGFSVIDKLEDKNNGKSKID